MGSMRTCLKRKGGGGSEIKCLRAEVKLLIHFVFYTKPSKSGCILPSHQVLVWGGFISVATVVGNTGLDHGCGSADYGVGLGASKFCACTDFLPEGCSGKLPVPAAVPMTRWSGGTSVCLLLAHLLGICSKAGLTGAKAGWLAEAKFLVLTLSFNSEKGGRGSVSERVREFYKYECCKCRCAHVEVSEHNLLVRSLFPL